MNPYETSSNDDLLRLLISANTNRYIAYFIFCLICITGNHHNNEINYAFNLHSIPMICVQFKYKPRQRSNCNTRVIMIHNTSIW